MVQASLEMRKSGRSRRALAIRCGEPQHMCEQPQELCAQSQTEPVPLCVVSSKTARRGRWQTGVPHIWAQV